MLKKMALATLLGLSTITPSYAEHKHDKRFYESFTNQDSLKQELENCQKTSIGYIRLSDLYLKQKDLGNSIEACEAALKQDPNSWEAYFNLSTNYTGLRQLDKAREYSKKAWNLCDNNVNRAHIMVNLACIESLCKNREGMRFYIDKGLEYDSTNKSLLKLSAMFQNQ